MAANDGGMRPNAAYRKLEVWRVSMDFVEECYKATRRFPREELYGLTSQVRRAAVSIPSNVAEGYCRRSTKAYANHISIALGSHAEVETCVEIAFRLRFLDDVARDSLEQSLASIGRLLHALHESLEEKQRQAEAKRTRRPENPVP
jgi:four helix bundle protein